ncbi:ACP S-malonyltransferase [Escherichia coli]|uniref:ACP S-malonyltransferase n=1 Tax=Escherichia coli TaxID=562 RepID=UPI000DE0B4CB|nr:ACP S-malonyltransferase [Escherichia coli]
MKNIIISKDGETLTVTEENIIAVAKLLGITPTELRKSVSQIFKSADAQKPTMQDLIKAKAEQIKQSKKGNY